MKAKEAQAKKKGTTYKPSENERALLARTGGLGRPAGQAIWPVRGRTIHGFGEPLQGELRWKGMVIAAPEAAKSAPSPTAASCWPTGSRGMDWWWSLNTARAI